MPQINCICGIFALHGIILHQGKGFVKGFSGFFLQKGKIRRNIKKLPKKRFRFLCILPVWFRRRIRRLCRREKCLRSKPHIHAKRGAFVHALRVLAGGGAPTPFLSCFFKSREKPRSGLCETATCVSCFEVCKTSELPAKGNGMLLFAACKK